MISPQAGTGPLGECRKETDMTSRRHVFLRVAVAVGIVLTGALSVATSPAHAEGSTIVIAFRDVTALGNCRIGFGRTLAEAAVPRLGCPAGSVWERSPMALADAQARHLVYIYPVVETGGKTIDNARTLRAEDDKLATLLPASSAMASPMVSCSGGPYYQTQIFGNGTVSFAAKARWFELLSGGLCDFNQVNDQIQQTDTTGNVEKWNYSWLDDAVQNQHQVSRGCVTIPRRPSFSDWQGGWGYSHPNALWKTEADQTAGGCGNWFDTYIRGQAYLLEQ